MATRSSGNRRRTALSVLLLFGGAVELIAAPGLWIAGRILCAAGMAAAGIAAAAGCRTARRRVPVEAGVLALAAYLAAAGSFVFYHVDLVPFAVYRIEGAAAMVRAADAGFSARFLLLCLPLSAALTCCAEGTAASVRSAGLADSSLLVRLLRALTAGKPLRRVLLVHDCLSALGALALVCGIWLAAAALDIRTDPRLSGAISALLAMLFFFLLSRAGARRAAVSDTEALCREIDALSAGAAPDGASVPETSPLYPAAQKLVGIGETVRRSVEAGIAGEKMKVELISNVSHDLKTPLTAILGYGELLQKEPLPAEAAAYVEKLNRKSAYLMELVEDVFELSKTASGNAVLQNAALDLRKLLEQSAAELYDKAEAAGIEFVLSLGTFPAQIVADGARLHRVFQNLIDNAVKYALRGTRVYLSLRSEGDRFEAELLNTASYRMEFTPETITERFARGDKARSGEGSGLGLAIAKTYTEACGGSFSIRISGDQFAALVTLPREPTEN